MKKIGVYLLILIGIITIGIISYLIFFSKIEVLLNGNDNVILKVFNEYNDDGIILKKNHKIIDNKNYKVSKNSNLAINKIGNYEIVYNVLYRNKNYRIRRNIKVIDDEKPAIDVNTNEVKKDYCTKKILSNFIYSATDNYDGDLTDKIEKIEDNDKIILKVKDTSNNEEIKEIKVKYNEKANNKFSLNGNKIVFVPANSKYDEKGASLIDGCGNEIKADIKITGEVNTNNIGEYEISYKVNNEVLKRTIVVYENAKEVFSDKEKVIYLTFDDGPGYYTTKILDILNKYNVKATFFVTNQFPSYTHLIKEEYEKGHKIAVHTYTHKYDVYYSIDNYFNDSNKMNEIIKTYTGSYTNLFRFPGGSSNTISKSYNKGIMKKLAKEMENNGYIYYDWNVSSADASVSATSSQIYNNVVNGVKKCTKCVVLMHDIKGTTANALDNILETLTNEGYTFATLNETSPTAHHGINN